MLFRHSLLLPLKMGETSNSSGWHKKAHSVLGSSWESGHQWRRPVHSKSLSAIQCFLGARILFPGPYKADGRTDGRPHLVNRPAAAAKERIFKALPAMSAATVMNCRKKWLQPLPTRDRVPEGGGEMFGVLRLRKKSMVVFGKRR